MNIFSYFAYGSNMLPSRLQARCPSARLIGVAMAQGYVLGFRKKSADESAKATLIAGEQGVVLYGALFEIAEAERAALDRCEGYLKGYDRDSEFPVVVEMTREVHKTTTYIATEQALVDNLKPYDWYKALVLAGAYELGLPRDYTTGLEAVSCRCDPVPGRRGRREALDALQRAGWELTATPPHIRRRSAF